MSHQVPGSLVSFGDPVSQSTKLPSCHSATPFKAWLGAKFFPHPSSRHAALEACPQALATLSGQPPLFLGTSVGLDNGLRFWVPCDCSSCLWALVLRASLPSLRRVSSRPRHAMVGRDQYLSWVER